MDSMVSCSQKGSKQYNNDLDKPCELIQLLAILAAIVAYQAGIDPPGGVWADNGASHGVGDPILLTTHPRRYKVFFYFNSVAFVASLVIMVMLQNEFLVRSHVLEAAMIFDLFCLIGAYAVGSCRDTSTSIYTVALAGGVLIYVVIHILFSILEKKSDKQGEEDKIKEHQLEKKRFPVLLDKFPIRYKAFFYCNAASFMASVALIVLLLNRNLYGPGIKCYALFVCMVAGMFGLIGAYAAGSSMHLRTSIVVLILVTVVFAAVVYVAIIGRGQRANINQHQSKQTQNQQTNKEDGMMDTPRQTQDQQEADMKKKADMMAKYLMLAGILAASVAYLTGLKPPGGLWRDEGNGHSAGNPVLYDIDKRRYNAFFYSNSTSFMASITVIVLLLRRMTKGDEHKLPLWPMRTAMLLDMLALLGAYAAGSTRNWCTFKDAILLLLPVLGFVVILFFWKKGVAMPAPIPSPEGTSRGKTVHTAAAGHHYTAPSHCQAALHIPSSMDEHE
uniref:Putative cadmium tolerance factor n=1 Tax=Oryza rufipogon TaxID=4529 RepID=A0A679BD19_ORYRU|nr:putative cadmium tolerance factor [Oryza rufipogon]